MQATTQGSTSRRLPDEIDLGYYTLTFDTDSDDLARQAAERINAAIKAEYARQYPLPSYSLELEIVGIMPGCKHVVIHAKGKKTLKGRIRDALIPLGFIGSLIMGYGDFKENAWELFEDLKGMYERVIPVTPTKPPLKDYKWNSNSPIDT